MFEKFLTALGGKFTIKLVVKFVLPLAVVAAVGAFGWEAVSTFVGNLSDAVANAKP